MMTRSCGNKYNTQTYMHADRMIHNTEHTILLLIPSKKAATRHIETQAKNSGIKFFSIDVKDNLIVQYAKSEQTATSCNLTNALV